MASPLRRVRHATRIAPAVLALLLSLVTVDAAGATRTATSSSRGAIGAGLRGPAGLTATAYAKGLGHVSALAADAQGRVWAATAAASDAGTDAVYLVGEGGATPQQVVTDVHTPLGLVWIAETLFVSQADSVVALTGFDGNRFTSRTTVVSFADGTGEVNGIAASNDGRLYVGISAPCNSCTPTARYSASIVSFLPDGSDLRVFARDIRAAIGLEFFPGTDDLFVTMNQRDDLGSKTPGDWLAVVQAGQSWGFPSCYGQDTAKCASVPDPVAELDEHAAVSGLAIVTGQLGTKLGTGAAVAEWVTGKVQWVRVSDSDGTYTGRTSAFLSGFENPVPVLLDGTGALFVGDWTSGKLYRITA